MNLPNVRPASAVSWGAGIALVAIVGIAFTLGFELAILALAGTVLVAVIALFWLSVRNLSGETPLSIDEALGLGAPTAAEEEKRAILRALKDLEFERSVGKISEQDYLEFSTRYRAEAKRLISAVDESLGPVQALAEELVSARLARAGLEPDVQGPESSPPASAPDARSCPSCKTDNDLDAVFCKRCGARFDEAGARAAPARAVEEEAP